MRNQFKSINIFAQSYVYIIMAIWKGPTISFLISERSLFAKPLQVWLKLANCLWTRIFPNVFSLLCDYLPWKWFWLKLAKWFLRRNVSTLSMYFLYFVIIFPWERAWPSFEQTGIPFTQGCFVLSLVKIGQAVL